MYKRTEKLSYATHSVIPVWHLSTFIHAMPSQSVNYKCWSTIVLGSNKLRKSVSALQRIQGACMYTLILFKSTNESRGEGRGGESRGDEGLKPQFLFSYS